MADINSKIFNTQKTDYETPSLFLGQDMGLLDTVNKRYPDIERLYKKMKSLDWDENEFDFTSCVTDFKTCDKSIYEIMIMTLAWQWEADSVAAKSISPIVASFVTSTELWAAWQRVGDNECLVDGTEVLTPGGWLDLKYVTKNTLVAQYDPNTKGISFVFPINLIEKDYEGSVFEFKNNKKHFHQVTTPGHRMLKRKNTTNQHIVELAETMDFSKGSANDQISGIVSGYVSDNFSKLSAIEKLLIAIQADGTISDRYTGEYKGTVPVWFGFSKAKKQRRIVELCEEANVELIHLTPDFSAGNRAPQKRYKINIPICYAPYLKNFNWVNLVDKGRTWCESFLEEILHWDGHFTKNTGILHTTSRQAVEVTQAVASLCGMKTHLGFYSDDRSETFSDCWRLSWKRQDFVSGQTIEKQNLYYKGKVRCITVPTGFFLMRYRDCVSVTGNCIHALTYSEIVRNSFDNPSDVLQSILAVNESIARMETIASVFSNTYQTSHKLALGLVEKNQETYDDIFMFVCAMYCLERIQFMASFAVTFAIADTGLFVPIGKAVQKICQDEFEVHAELDKGILNHELQTDFGLMAFNRNKTKIKNMIDEVVLTEHAWIDKLFSEGRELLGVTPELLKAWVLYNAGDVYSFFRFEPIADIPKKIPLGFMTDWMNINAIQAAPQEEKTGAYMLGMVVNDAGSDVIEIDL